MRKLVLEQNGWLSGEIAPEYQGRTDLTALRYGAAHLDNLVVGAGGALKKRPGTWQMIRPPKMESVRVFVLTQFLVHAENIEAWRRFNADEIERVIPLHEAVANNVRNSAERREKHRQEALRLRGLLPAAKQLSEDERRVKSFSYALRESRYTPEVARQILALTHHNQAIPFHEVAYAENRTKGFFRVHNTFLTRTFPVTNAAQHGTWSAEQFLAAQYTPIDSSTWIFVTPTHKPMLLRKQAPNTIGPTEALQGNAIWELQTFDWDTDKITKVKNAPVFKPESASQIFVHHYTQSGNANLYWAYFSAFSGHPNWHTEIVYQRLRMQDRQDPQNVKETLFRVAGQRTVSPTADNAEHFFPHLPEDLRGGTESLDFVFLLRLDGTDPVQDQWVDDWDIHAFGTRMGWPAAVAFHENRLVLAGSSTWGQGRLWLSKIGDPLNFAIGEGLADDALDLSLTEDDKICSLASGTELEIYAERGEWALSGSPITAEQARLRKVGTRGSRSVPYAVQPVRAAGGTVFVDRNGSPAALRWVGETLQHQSESLRGLAPHIASDFVSLAWDPAHDRLLGVKSDGTMACGTWLPEQNTLAWTSWDMLPRRYANEGDRLQDDLGTSGFLSVSAGSGIVCVTTRRESRNESLHAVEILLEDLGLDSAVLAHQDSVAQTITRMEGGEGNTRATLDPRWEVLEVIPFPLAAQSLTDSGMKALVGTQEQKLGLLSRYRPLFTDRLAPAFARRLFSTRVGLTTELRYWGATIETQITPLPVNLPPSARSGRGRVRLVSLELLVRRAPSVRRSALAHAHGLLSHNEDLGLFQVAGRVFSAEAEANLLRRVPSGTGASTGARAGTDAQQEQARELATLRLRGANWQAASNPLWTWLQPFANTAEILSAKTELRIGDL